MIIVGATLYAAWRDQQKTDAIKIPPNISSSLLFTPYLPTVMPKGYSIDQDSFKIQETALLFTASNEDKSNQFVFSEQAVPKDVDVEAFFGSSVSDPTRLEGLRYKTLFGQLHASKGTLTSIVTTDDTWILITTPQPAAKADAQTIEEGLVRQ